MSRHNHPPVTFQHERTVPVPEMTRITIGRLVRTLGSLKSECGGDLSKTKLRLVWHETSGERYVARGEVQVRSLNASITKRAALAVAALLQQLAPDVKQTDEQRFLAQKFGEVV